MRAAERNEFPEATNVLGAPAGQEEGVFPLVVCRVDYADGPAVVSKWTMSPDELAKVLETGVVWLSVMGSTMPPAVLSVDSPLEAKRLRRDMTTVILDLKKAIGIVEMTDDFEADLTKIGDAVLYLAPEQQTAAHWDILSRVLENHLPQDAPSYDDAVRIFSGKQEGAGS